MGVSINTSASIDTRTDISINPNVDDTEILTPTLIPGLLSTSYSSISSALTLVLMTAPVLTPVLVLALTPIDVKGPALTPVLVLLIAP